MIAGLLPLFFGHGTGSATMQRIAAPMVGGMLSAPLLTMLVLPTVYWLISRRRLPPASDEESSTRDHSPSFSNNPLGGLS